jgi:hypothetical protein
MDRFYQGGTLARRHQTAHPIGLAERLAGGKLMMKNAEYLVSYGRKTAPAGLRSVFRGKNQCFRNG